MKNLLLLFFIFFLYAQDVKNKEVKEKKAVVEVSQEDQFLNKINPVVVAITHKGATGSGFIISENGYILTNGHVIHNPDIEEPLKPSSKITVTLWNEKKYEATVIGFNLDPDIALLKIIPDSLLQVAKIGDSKKVTTSQSCYAFGSPYGIKKTLTKGIISRAGLTDLQTFTKLFQIDAVINPGNSGGPLFNKDGEVIGINTYRSPKSGLGYSIPIHFAMQAKDHYLKYGRLIRSDIPYFFAKAMTQDYADYFGVPRGIFIDYVKKDSYAWEQGMRTKDVIIKMNGQEVSGRTEEDFYDWIWEASLLPVGSTVNLTIIRQDEDNNNNQINLSIIAKESDALPNYGYQFGEIPEVNYNAFGFHVQEINTLLWFMRTLPKKEGVRISSVAKDSLADDAFFNEDGVIYELNGKKINNLETFKKVMNQELLTQKQYFIFKFLIKNDEVVSVITPRYRIKGKNILLISSDDNDYLSIYEKNLRMEGAKVTVSINEKTFADTEWDAIILSGINDDNQKMSKNILTLLQKADKSKVVLAGDRKSPQYFLQIDKFKSLKMTMDKSLITEKNQDTVDYSGEDIEKDNNLITSTVIDREIAQRYISTIIDVIYKNSFR